MNFKRKSTDGFSIGYILLDFFGALTSFLQMVVQSIDQGLLLHLPFHLNLSPVHNTFLNLLLFSRFFGELLWKQREDVVISGIEYYSLL
jgi:hypothetical protein